jgi:hypothetical protein
MDSLKRRDGAGTQRQDHAAMARDRLLLRGQTALAEIANRHMPYQARLDPRRPETWEQKLVHFADKLAEGSRLVTPEERMAALKTRYPRSAQELEASAPRLFELQDEICTVLGTSPTGLIARLRAALGL